MFWYSYLFKNFPEFVVVHTAKGFGIVNKAEVDVFLELCKTALETLLLLLLLLSRFSRVRLCATPSLGFSRQEQCSGLPFPSPMQKSESEVAQLYPTLSNPMDCSPPGSSVHRIFQARVLEWGAIAFSRTRPVPKAIKLV